VLLLGPRPRALPRADRSPKAPNCALSRCEARAQLSQALISTSQLLSDEENDSAIALSQRKPSLPPCSFPFGGAYSQGKAQDISCSVEGTSAMVAPTSRSRSVISLASNAGSVNDPNEVR
jgi:hypothetical protein